MLPPSRVASPSSRSSPQVPSHLSLAAAATAPLALCIKRPHFPVAAPKTPSDGFPHPVLYPQLDLKLRPNDALFRIGIYMRSSEGRHHTSVHISCDWRCARKYGVAEHCELQWETAAGGYTDLSFASQTFCKLQSLQKGAQDSGKTCIPGLPLSCNGMASASPYQSKNA